MALINCPACGSDVSSDAPACPKCGHPIASANKTSKKLSCGWWLVIIVAIIWIFGFLIPEYGGSTSISGGNSSGNGSSSYSESVLYRFRGGSDGADPSGSLIMDSAGNLYGTTANGGRSGCPNGCGVVFKLAPDGSGGYTESTLYRFRGGSDGAYPSGSLIMDSAGNLYGTTTHGGNRYGDGVVFKLAPDGSGGYTESVLYRFRGGRHAATPFGRLIMDGAGNLYGTTSGGLRSLSSRCPNGCGVVFKLAPDGSGGYTESVLYRFRGGSDGDNPSGSLIMDSAGNLYGTTDGGLRSRCPSNGCGVVFKLAPDGSGGYTESVLYRFRGGSDGDNPSGSLIMDSAGNLYGTTGGGGIQSFDHSGCGIVYEIRRH